MLTNRLTNQNMFHVIGLIKFTQHYFPGTLESPQKCSLYQSPNRPKNPVKIPGNYIRTDIQASIIN